MWGCRCLLHLNSLIPGMLSSTSTWLSTKSGSQVRPFPVSRVGLNTTLTRYRTTPDQPRQEILITLPSGDTKTGTSWFTTPMEVAASIAKSLPEKIIIAKVNGALWDLHRPLEASCDLALLDFDSPDNNYEAKQVFWHSSAHVLGEACERCLEGCCLGYGPPQEDGGFFYEMRLGDNR